jgi:hypothetical protein
MVGVEGLPFIHLYGSRLLTKLRTGTDWSGVLLYAACLCARARCPEEAESVVSFASAGS